MIWNAVYYQSRQERTAHCGTDPWKRYRIEKNATWEIKLNSQFANEFWILSEPGKPEHQEEIQNQTQEFDPGSGRTLAACLTHASRAEIEEELARNQS